MNKERTDVLEAIEGLEKVASELSPANGKRLLVRAKYSFDGLTAGNVYEVIEHSGWYYWMVFLGKWVDKEGMERVVV